MAHQMQAYRVSQERITKFIYKIIFRMAVQGWIYNNWIRRYRVKKKPSGKRYDRKRERSINKNPKQE